jgi:hypothetical protein
VSQGGSFAFEPSRLCRHPSKKRKRKSPFESNFFTDQLKKKEICVWLRGLGLPGLWGVMLLPLWRHAGAVHEHDLPHISLFLKEGRFQPLLFHGAGGVSDAALIDV